MNAIKTGAVLCAFLVFAACAPIGGIGGSGEVDTFWIVPKRLDYEASVPFSRKSDFEAFGLLDGEVVQIPIDTVNIGVVENPAAPDAVYWVPDGEWFAENDRYWWKTGIGEKIIVINYQSMSDRYTINVNNPGAGGGPSGGGNDPPGGTADGWEIIVEWG